jgi:hypothetical protein
VVPIDGGPLLLLPTGNMKPQGKYLNRQRYRAEGLAAYAADPTAGERYLSILSYLSPSKSPCPYTRWWKVFAWWRGYMKARDADVQCRWLGAGPSLADVLGQNNTYAGIERQASVE